MLLPAEQLELKRLINDYATSYFVSDKEYQETDFKNLCSYIEQLKKCTLCEELNSTIE